MSRIETTKASESGGTNSASALFYFFYCAAIGIYLPYWTLYLRHLEFTSLQIATLYSIPALARIGIPLFTGYIADRFNRRRHLLIAASIAQVIPLVLIHWLHSYGWMLFLVSAFAVLNSIVLPLGEATTQEEHEKGKLDYGRTRLWGTLSFILLAVIYGRLLDFVNDSWILSGILISYVVLFIATLFMPEGKISLTTPKGSLRSALVSHSTWIFLGCVFLMNASHGSFYGFYSIYLADLGFHDSGIGIHWAVAAGSELIIFIFASQIMRHYRVETLIRLCCLTASLRWFLTGSFTNFISLTLIQCLHAFSFGLFHATCMNLIHQIFPLGFRSIGQSLYYSLGGGAGTFTGVMLCGLFWDQYGGRVYYASGTVMIMAFLLSLKFRVSTKQNSPQSTQRPPRKNY